MGKATLVIMAAGLGSRYNGGIKQLASVGPNGEIIMDYSIYDAVEAGFDKIVFVIRKALEKEFKEVIGDRIAKKIHVEYVFQETDDIPDQYKEKFCGRKKPWGTGQAILCCKNAVKEPFLVINADDYYGKQAYKEIYAYLRRPHNPSEKMDIGMVGFVLRNTLSANGTVTRGICKIGDGGMLSRIEETYNIKRQGDRAISQTGEKVIPLDLESPVSMNMWAFWPDFFELLEERFLKFLDELSPEDITTEYLLPRIIGEMLAEGKVQVKVIESRDKWFGVTYKEDREEVVRKIRELIMRGEYPNKI